jgi:hypothetical protein
MQVHVSPDVNDDRPIPVDVVFVWDKKTAAKLDALTAKAWFDQKTALRRDDPDERAFTVRNWEWVLGKKHRRRTRCLPRFASMAPGDLCVRELPD